MINRLLKSDIFAKEIVDPTSCKEYIINFMDRYNYTHVEKTTIAQNVDKALSKKIMHHLELFFNKSNGKSLKTRRKKIIKSKTLKKRPV